MKKLGWIMAIAGITAGAVYAGTRLFSKSKGNKTKKDNTSKEEEDEDEVVSSISRSYVYVADF
jgi:hypothetical protein